MEEKLFDLIKKEKPNVKDKTINMYLKNLIKLSKMVTGEDEFKDIDFLKNVDKVSETLDHLHYTTKRNYYNAIIVTL